METVALVLALAAGFYMAWNIGANDVANAMGTSVGSGALTYRRAVIVGAVLEFSGAVLVGAHVTETVRKKIITPTDFTPDVLMLGMMAALLGAGAWLQLASRFGRPVSTTHSIVGAVFGFGIVVAGPAAVNWSVLGRIVASWFISPLIAGTLAYLLFTSVQRLVLNSVDPARAAVRWSPLYAAAVLFMLTLVTVFKGLKNLRLHLSFRAAAALATGVGLAAAAVCRAWAQRIQPALTREEREEGMQPMVVVRGLADVIDRLARLRDQALGPLRDRLHELYETAAGLHVQARSGSVDDLSRSEMRFAERVFGALQVLTACAMAFAHGSNDVGNATGPFAAVVAIATAPDKTAALTAKTGVPLWVLCIGGLGISVGLATYGWRVMQTIGSKITDLTPTRGFAAEFAASTTIVVASRLGLPVSTTHTIVGGVMGVGFARGLASLNPKVLRDIGVAWLIEIPAAAVFTVLIFYVLRVLWGV